MVEGLGREGGGRRREGGKEREKLEGAQQHRQEDAHASRHEDKAKRVDFENSQTSNDRQATENETMLQDDRLANPTDKYTDTL